MLVKLVQTQLLVSTSYLCWQEYSSLHDTRMTSFSWKIYDLLLDRRRSENTFCICYFSCLHLENQLPSPKIINRPMRSKESDMTYKCKSICQYATPKCIQSGMFWCPLIWTYIADAYTAVSSSVSKILTPDWGSNPGLWWWEPQVLTTGLVWEFESWVLVLKRKIVIRRWKVERKVEHLLEKQSLCGW